MSGAELLFAYCMLDDGKDIGQRYDFYRGYLVRRHFGGWPSYSHIPYKAIALVECKLMGRNADGTESGENFVDIIGSGFKVVLSGSESAVTELSGWLASMSAAGAASDADLPSVPESLLQAEITVCGHCGSAYKRGSEFCAKCGTARG